MAPLSARPREMRARHCFAVYSLLVAMSAGCSNTTTPPAPVTIVDNNRLIIGGVRTLREGETAALTVSVRMASGGSKPVVEGAAVRWSSDNRAVVTVSDRGVVTAVRAGFATITAFFDNPYGSMYGSAQVLVGSRGQGFVHESAPDKRAPVSGASIVIVDVNGATQSIRSDAGGQFSMNVPNGLTRFTVSAAGYETTDVSINVSAGVNVSLGLLPIGVRERFGVPIEEWRGGPIRGAPLRQAAFSIVVSEPGTIRVYADGCLSDCTGVNRNFFCAEVRDSRNNLVSSFLYPYDDAPYLPNVETKGGERYEIKVGVCPQFDPTYVMNRYYIDVIHPR